MFLSIHRTSLLHRSIFHCKLPNISLLLVLVIPCALQVLMTIVMAALLLLHQQQVKSVEPDSASMLLLICLISLTMTIATAIYLSRKLARPILRLSDASQKVARGEDYQPINMGRVEELAIVASSFNQMAQEIQQSRQTREEYFQALEQKVYERTRELEVEIRKRTAIEAVLHQANQQLEHLAFVDSLTQVANRRHFDDRLNQEWWRLRRAKAPLSIILCDIDYFKQYNDTYGHQAGDTCLRKVAAALQMAVKRPADVVARYGGEEFAIILPNTPTAGAVQVAREIQTLVKQLQLPHQSSAVSESVTLSLGIVSVIPQSGSSSAQLIACVDRALYQAKSKGRNCVIVDKFQPESRDLQFCLNQNSRF